MDSLAELRAKAARVDEVEEFLASIGVQRDRKIEAQRKELVRLLAEVKRLKAELQDAIEQNKSTEPYKENQNLRVTIAIQKRAIQERQDYIDNLRGNIGQMLAEGDVFK